MKISIVTTVKNGERYLRDCILSVLNQKAEVHLEYLIVDGGSDDGSGSVIKETQELVSSGLLGNGMLSTDLKAFFNTDNSMYEGLGYGLKRVTGDVILYLNSDDILQNDAFRKIKTVFEKYHDVHWVTGYPNQIDESGRVFYKNLPWRYRTDFVLKGYYGTRLPFIQQESCFWKRSLLEGMDWEKFEEFNLAGDQYLWVYFAQQTELRILPEIIGSHRTHGDQLTHKYRESYFVEYRSIIDAIVADKKPDLRGLERYQVLADRLRWLIPDSIKRVIANHYLKFG